MLEYEKLNLLMGTETLNPPETIQKSSIGTSNTIDSTKRYEQLDNIRFKERAGDITGQLAGKDFKTPASISLLYPDKDMKKSPMIFNTDKQTIIYNNQTIQLSLPMGAGINMVAFRPDTILVQGSKFGISKEGSVSYESFIKGIDDVLAKKQTSIPSENGNINMKIV